MFPLQYLVQFLVLLTQYYKPHTILHNFHAIERGGIQIPILKPSKLLPTILFEVFIAIEDHSMALK